ncbi:MAG TPA: hypothetical protein VH253_20620 [Phycisphaerae bacterium]|nr:hypothetical protein [Phycisphaerae bacterium]
MVDLENSANPFAERRNAIAAWRSMATIDLSPATQILSAATPFTVLGLHSKDALHIAAAIAAGCGYFITTDDRVLKKAQQIATIKVKVVNPLQFLIEVP